MIDWDSEPRTWAELIAAVKRLGYTSRTESGDIMKSKREHHGHDYKGDGKQSHGAPGSHEESHKSMKDSRGRIEEGMPSELESFHGGDEG